MEYMGLAGVAAISVICWLAGEAVKLSPLEDKFIPVICGVIGGMLGLLGMYAMPDFPAGDLMSAAAIGIVSGLAATGADQIGKQMKK